MHPQTLSRGSGDWSNVTHLHILAQAIVAKNLGPRILRVHRHYTSEICITSSSVNEESPHGGASAASDPLRRRHQPRRDSCCSLRRLRIYLHDYDYHQSHSKRPESTAGLGRLCNKRCHYLQSSERRWARAKKEEKWGDGDEAHP